MLLPRPASIFVLLAGLLPLHAEALPREATVPPTATAEIPAYRSPTQKEQAKALRSALEAVRLGAPVNTRNKQGMTALMLAASAGDDEAFMELVISGADVHLEAPGKISMLMLAAAGGSEGIFNRMLNYVALNAAQTDANGTPLFHYACMGGNEAIAQRVQQAGGNPFAVNRKGHGAILYAARSGNTNLFHNLLNRGARPLLRTKDGYNLLIAAAQGGNYNIVQTALHMGIPADTQDHAGNTALMAAARYAPAEVVDLLLRKGANPAARDKRGINAAMLAAAVGNAESCLRLGGSIDMPPDNDGRTLLLYAASGGSRTLLRSLLQNTPQLTEKEIPALHAAIAAGHTSAAFELAARLPRLSREELHSIPVNSLDDAIIFCTFVAEHAKSTMDRSTAELLMRQVVAAGNNPKALSAPEQSAMGRTPLQNAISGRFSGFVRFLIAQGADINATDRHGKTALMTATETGNYHIAKILLKAGANPNTMDHAGYTPIILSAKYGNTAIFLLLTEHGANPNRHRNGGPTALQAAMAAGPRGRDILNILSGTPTLPTTRTQAYTELCQAMEQQNTEHFRRILAAWPEPDAATPQGYTLLMHAAEHPCNESFMRHLISLGANVNARDQHGFSALFYAHSDAKKEILRQAGATE